VLSEDVAEKVWVHLYGGEQDGFRRRIALKTKPPKKFYIWHVNDGAKIEEVRGIQRSALQNRLATMAYELFEEVMVPDSNSMVQEYRYRRCESADKVAVDPAC